MDINETDNSDSEIKEAVKKITEFDKTWEELVKKITGELKPFVEGFGLLGDDTNNYVLFKEAYDYFTDKFTEKLDLFHSILKTESHACNLNDRLNMLFLYLGAVESVGNCIVDILVLLLVANGRDFHIECSYRTPSIRHVVSIRDDLEKERVPLGTKLNFLREHGINTVSSVIDSKLRNCIAHLKFEVKGERVYLNGKDVEEDVTTGLIRLIDVVFIVIDILRNIAKERGFFSDMFEKKIHELRKKWRCKK